MLSEEYRYRFFCDGEGCFVARVIILLSRNKKEAVKILREYHGWRVGKYHFCPKCARAVRGDTDV